MSSSSTVTAPTKRKLRPARKQVEPDEIDRSEKIQAGKEYNVWYNKWAGGDKEDDLANKTLAQTRCVISRDAGYTRADATGNKYCCLFFARGCCPYGQDCAYLHRLPLPSHQLPDNSRDCFGREKHGEYRDDMGGVGSFNRVNRTIYIAKMGETPDKKQVEETLLRHFKEWGKVIRHNILYGRGIAFVTYENELNAQFAKEAMANQSMDMDEILNVRWAIEDPNPGEVRREAARIEQLGKEAIKGMLDEGIVEAAQTIRALEDGDEEDFYPIEESGALPEEEEEDEQQDGRAAKRIKSSAQAGNSTAKETLGSGLLSGEAMENLKYYADLARQQAEERKRKVPAAAPPAAVKKPQAKPTSGGLAALGGYASDSD